MRAHSSFSASSAARLIACPGSYGLTQEMIAAGIETDRPSVYAAQGTVAHTVAEELLHHRGDPKGQAAIKDHYRGSSVVLDGHVITPDEAFLDHVQTYTNYIETLEAFDYELFFEQRVSPDLPWLGRGEVPPLQLFGTSDCFGIHRRKNDIVVLDLKFGSGVTVDVFENAQLLYYALGVISSLFFKRAIDAATPVELVVIQPRIAGGHEPKLWNTTVNAITRWGDDVLRPAVEAVLDPLAQLDPGSHCKWCPAKVPCPALKDLATQKIRELFADGYNTMKVLPPDTLAEDLLCIEPLEIWIETLREEAIRRLVEGKLVPGHKLVAKRATRSWSDPAAAVTYAEHEGYDITTVMSPAQAEKAAPKCDFTPLVTKQSSGVTLAQESDPRPAVYLPNPSLREALKGSLAS